MIERYPSPRVELTIGGTAFAVSSVDIAENVKRAPVYNRGSVVGMTRGTYSFTMEAKGEEFDAFARIFDEVRLPDSMDLTVTLADAEPEVLRVLRDVWPTEEGGLTVLSYPIFHGPRLADGRWTRSEAAPVLSSVR